VYIANVHNEEVLKVSNARQSELRLAPNYMVVPPGECNGMIAEPLVVYSESFLTIAATAFP